jgi:hypothetical protein
MQHERDGTTRVQLLAADDQGKIDCSQFGRLRIKDSSPSQASLQADQCNSTSS